MNFTHFLVLAWFFVALNSTALAKVEGAIFPVIKDAKITSIEAVNDHTSLISGSFEKLRRCQFAEMKLIFRDKATGAETASEVIFRTRPQARAVGPQSFDEWEVRVAEDQLQNSAFYTQHECLTSWLVLKHRVFTRAPIEIVER